MAELRFNPFKNDWVMVASHRQNRPQMPKDWCPFCPGSGKVPDNYTVHKYNNDFPALSTNPPEPDDVDNAFFKTAPSYGVCEVILYSPKHSAVLWELSDEHVLKLVELWAERTKQISRDKKIKYVFIFENRGDVVGVTMPHPHGQIYGYPFVPKKMETELDNAKAYRAHKNSCLFCDWIKNELQERSRVIFEDAYFAVVLPFFAESAFGVQIVPKRHVSLLTQLNEEEQVAFAKVIKQTVGMYDSLYDMPFPYMMCLMQAPVNMQDHGNAYHFHVQFFTPMRSKEKQQFNASSETGAWAHCNPTAPEEMAELMREAHQKFLKK